MATPEQRVAAPGKQVVRADNVKDRSWADPNTPMPPLVGRIYFVTDGSTLDDSDMAQLEKLINPYQQLLSKRRDMGGTVNFDFLGYCDHRAGKEYNYNLAQKRADAVANFFDQKFRFQGYSSYSPTSKGVGIDYSITGTSNSQDLAPCRRVDIHADPLPEDPKPAPPAPGVALSNTWKARIYDGAGAGLSVATVDAFHLEIADLENNLAMSFAYKGAGFGWSYKGLPGVNMETSSWYPFKTMLKYNIMDFEGDAAHMCLQGQLSVGYGLDAVTLWGKASKRITPRARLVWEDFTKFAKAAGAGASVTGGILLPSPTGQKPYWPTRIP